MNPWLEGLNPEQSEAVLHDKGPLLILAGAGSGKTTVLVSRTGRLIAEKKTKADRVCVLTFTNKAAQELKARVARRLGDAAQGVWAGTFHGFGLRFLKEHWREAELPERFGVIDASDAQAVLKDLLRDHKAYEKSRLNLEVLQAHILYWRQKGRDNPLDKSIESAVSLVLAPKYLQRLRRLGVVDFEELLLRPLKMMRENESLAHKMHGRFDFVMVDEFQDTNLTQMEFVDQLTEGHRNIAVVGDDDQSIYGWRGAEIQNILGFPKRYKGCKVIRLERNYRSTPKILNMANAIIKSNQSRHEKVLKASLGTDGELPELFVFPNEEAEVEEVVKELSAQRQKGYRWRDMAVLYRSNSQGGLMEGGLRRTQIPYKLSGGTALFDRREAKDVLAYLRSSLYPNEVAFRRVINLPPRGLGDKSLETIEGVVGKDFFTKAKRWAEGNPDDKGAVALSGFFNFLQELKARLIAGPGTAEEIFNDEFRRLGYRDYIQQSYRDPKAADSRWLCVSILGRILDGMFERHGRSLKVLEDFLDLMELRDAPGEDDGEPADEVQMMTLHACKGLEFPLVILLGLEEDLLPHVRLGQNTDEERRLFYVGVTRARKHLILTRVESRKRYGHPKPVSPSRFLMELDPALYHEMRGGRPLAVGAREKMLADLYQKLNRQIGEKQV